MARSSSLFLERAACDLLRDHFGFAGCCLSRHLSCAGDHHRLVASCRSCTSSRGRWRVAGTRSAVRADHPLDVTGPSGSWPARSWPSGGADDSVYALSRPSSRASPRCRWPSRISAIGNRHLCRCVLGHRYAVAVLGHCRHDVSIAGYIVVSCGRAIAASCSSGCVAFRRRRRGGEAPGRARRPAAGPRTRDGRAGPQQAARRTRRP